MLPRAGCASTLSDLDSARWRAVRLGWRWHRRRCIPLAVHRWGIAVETSWESTHCQRKGDKMFTEPHTHTHKGWGNKALSVCFTCIGVCVLQRPLCSGSICVKESRAAKVGQGHIHYPSACTRLCVRPTVSKDLCCHETGSSQSTCCFHTFISSSSMKLNYYY